jgi:hypothetical protein
MTVNESATTTALRALAYLLGDEIGLNRFQALTGIAENDIREGIEDPAFLVGVLDYYLGNERELLEMCDATGLPPDAPQKARFELARDASAEP